MKRNVLGVLTAVLVVAASAPAAQAQNPMSFGIAAGASIPVGDAGDDVKTGFHGMATIGLSPAMVPFGLRIDGMYNSLEGKDAFESVKLRILGLTANGVWQMPGMVASPYLIGGVGLYNQDVDVEGAKSENDFGLNVGIGMKFNLSGFGTFAEVRYHNLFDSADDRGNTAFIPLTFGIMF